MAIATWWRGDALPKLASLTEFSAVPTGNQQLLAQLTGLTPAEIQYWLEAGHHPYLGYLAGELVGLTPLDDNERTLTVATLLGVPLWKNGLSPHWYCGGVAYPARLEAAVCTCHSLRKPVHGPGEIRCPYGAA